MALVLPGASQPALARALDLDLTGTGLLGSALALGLGIGVVGAGPIADRGPRRGLFMGSCALAAVALLGVPTGAGLPGVLASLALAGIGLGAYETLLNTALTERYGAGGARALTLVHSAATAGAVLGPALLAGLQTRLTWDAGFRGLGAGLALLAIAGPWVSFPKRTPPADAGGGAPLRGLWLYAGVAACYVGLEAAVTVFTPAYARGALGLGPARGALGISAFWLGLLAGRLAYLALPGPARSIQLFAMGAGGAAVLALGCALGLRQLEGLLLATGFVLGAVFPLVVALAAERFAQARGTAAGLVAGAGSVGGVAIPWLTGVVGDRAGVALAFGSIAVWALLLGGLALGIHRARRADTR